MQHTTVIAVALARITKAILDDENAVLPLSVFQEGQYGVKNVFIGQPAVVGAHGIVRPVNIPLNDAETQKMQASAKELQAIIDEAWKNPEFEVASKKLIVTRFSFNENSTPKTNIILVFVFFFLSALLSLK